MRLTWLAALLAMGLSGQAVAQTGYIRVVNCGDYKPPVGSSQGSMDQNGNICTSGISTAPAILGFGTLAVTAASTLVSTMTAGPNSAAWNATPPGAVYVLNDAASAGNLYVCPLGGTCSATVGLELTPGRSWGFYKPAATMTVFATTTSTAQFHY